jgi:hypothetical protein
MKKFISILLFSFISFTITLQAASEERTTKAFTAIESNSSIDIIITQGDEYKITVLASEKYLHKIETKVMAGTLVVDVHGNIYSTEDFEVHVTVQNLKEIVMNASGDIEIEGLLQAESLVIEVHGSGDFEGDLNVKDLDISLHGSGDVELSGVNGSLNAELYGSGDFEADNIHLGNSYFSINGSGDVEVSGTAAMMEIHQQSSGDFDGRSFQVKTAKIRKSSSGDTDVYVTDTVDVKISGSGDVSIKGKPEISNFSATGSGDIRTI